MALEIIMSEPTKTDTTWEARVTGRVTGPPRKNPLPGVTITLYVQGQRIGERISDGNGRVRWLLTDLKPGRYLVELEAGEPANARTDETLVIREEAPAKPPRVKDLRVWTPGGEKGKYTFSISVTGEDGRPVKGARIRIFNKEGEMIVEQDTDEHGTLTPAPQVIITEPFDEFLVDLVGTELERRIRLAGPSRLRRAPEVPEPTAAELRKDFFTLIRDAFRAGKGGTS